MDREILGYFKLDGELVKDGYMDAKISAEFLTGLDEVVHLLVRKQVPDLKGFDFEIPVRVKQGSWEALIGYAALAGGTVFAGSYLKEAGKQMAEHDWKDHGFKDVIQKALEGVQWIIRIGKHLGDLTQKKFEDALFNGNPHEVGIRNADGLVLYVPKKFLDLYASTPPRVLAKISGAIETERKLVVGVAKDSVFVEETITKTQKYIFTQEDEDQDIILFPEMVHGEPIDLEGLVTRGNATANNMGFKYKEHILTCYPEEGSITKYKNAMFLRCKVIGRVNRTDDHGHPTAKRPKIIFTDLTPIDQDAKGSPLLSER